MKCVEPSIGICSYKDGKYGRFCKHQRIIDKYFKFVVVNFPPITVEDKFLVSNLALVIKRQVKHFMKDFYLKRHYTSNIQYIQNIFPQLNQKNKTYMEIIIILLKKTMY